MGDAVVASLICVVAALPAALALPEYSGYLSATAAGMTSVVASPGSTRGPMRNFEVASGMMDRWSTSHSKFVARYVLHIVVWPLPVPPVI